MVKARPHVFHVVLHQSAAARQKDIGLGHRARFMVVRGTEGLVVATP